MRREVDEVVVWLERDSPPGVEWVFGVDAPRTGDDGQRLARPRSKLSHAVEN